MYVTGRLIFQVWSFTCLFASTPQAARPADSQHEHDSSQSVHNFSLKQRKQNKTAVNATHLASSSDHIQALSQSGKDADLQTQHQCEVSDEGEFTCKEGQTIGKDAICTVHCKHGQPEKPTITCKCQKLTGFCGLSPIDPHCHSTSEGLNGALDEACFPRSSQVSLAGSKGEKGIAELQSGDEVLGLTWDGKELQVTEYLADMHGGHPEQNLMFEFLQVQHECQLPDRPLRLTAEHLVHVVSDGKVGLKPARTLQPSQDKLLATSCSNKTDDLQLSMVTSVSVVKEIGIHNPLTASNTLIVDGVATSNFAVPYSKREAWDSSAWNRMVRISWWVTLLPRASSWLGVRPHWVSWKELQKPGLAMLERLVQAVG